MKNFTKLNESFICYHCSSEVKKHPTSSRDHCNYCLYGLHVDVNPGDRSNECRGNLIPVGIKIANGKTQIVYKCQKCSLTTFCITSVDDNKEEIIELSKKIWT